ncbi:MAG: alpha/beta hydrolase, partial [Clostridia bacterium]|nr:alpha/beta hydrolase [Clostridia bacterium]
MKKLLCLILSLVMLLSCSAIAFAAETEDHLPQIYVNGIGSRAIYEVGDESKTSLFYPVNSEALMANLGRFPEYAEAAIKKNNPEILAEAVYSIMMDSMGKVAMNPDGVTSVHNVTIDPCPLDYRGDGKYSFNYDSRLDPVDLAAQLYEYVGWVKEHSGQERYELVGSSYGSAIIAAYMCEYGEKEMDNIDSVLLCVPSLPGIDFVGEVFSGSFNFDADVVVDFVKYMVGNEDLDLVLSILNKSGALEKILEYFLEPVVQVGLMSAVDRLVHDLFGTLPAMWTFVQDEYFYAALERAYGKDYASKDHSHAKLIEKITYYHENVMVAAPEIFLDAQEKGVHMN